jgi:type II secretion system protein I
MRRRCSIPGLRFRAAGRPAGAQRTGFTLLEVLVALAIMAIAATLLMQLFTADLRAIAASGDATSAAVRGDFRIRQLLAGGGLEEKTWSEETEDGYRLDIAVAEVLKQRTESLPVRLLAVELTVRWSEGRRQKSLRLRTVKMIDKAASPGAAAPAPA